MSDVTTHGKLTSGSGVFRQYIQGSRFYGWIVRVLSAGTIVRVESDQPELKTAAEETPLVFDTAIAESNQ